MGHWLWWHFGLGPMGQWWGLLGGDLAYLGVPVALYLHHMNCHEDRCWRPGRRVTVEDNGHHYRRCRRHHAARHG